MERGNHPREPRFAEPDPARRFGQADARSAPRPIPWGSRILPQHLGYLSRRRILGQADIPTRSEWPDLGRKIIVRKPLDDAEWTENSFRFHNEYGLARR